MSLDKLTFGDGENLSLELKTQLSYLGPDGLSPDPLLSVDIWQNRRLTEGRFEYDTNTGVFVNPEDNRALAMFHQTDRARIVSLLSEAAETYALLRRSGRVDRSILK